VTGAGNLYIYIYLGDYFKLTFITAEVGNLDVKLEAIL
jgi:hypothetical protein